jgi:hypothetical protein
VEEVAKIQGIEADEAAIAERSQEIRDQFKGQ